MSVITSAVQIFRVLLLLEGESVEIKLRFIFQGGYRTFPQTYRKICAAPRAKMGTRSSSLAWPLLSLAGTTFEKWVWRRVALRFGRTSLLTFTKTLLAAEPAVSVPGPALCLPRLPSEMLVLKSLLQPSRQSGVVLLHTENVHKPSTSAELTSQNFLTTHLIIYNCLPKGFLLLFDHPVLVVFIHIFNFMYTSVWCQLAHSDKWSASTYVNVCRKEALILFISFISLKENNLWSVNPVSMKNSSRNIVLLLANNITAAVGHEHCWRTLSEGLSQPVLRKVPFTTFKYGSKMCRVREKCPEFRHQGKLLPHSNQNPCPYWCQSFITGILLWAC